VETAVIFASLVVLAAPRQGANGAVILFAQILIFLVIAYFLIFRPQRREQERHQQRLDALKKGDEVVTAGGIIGTVLHAEEDRLTIRSGESTRLVVERARIAKVITPQDAGERKDAVAKEKTSGAVEALGEATETEVRDVREVREAKERSRDKGRGSRRN
jgi:preprotein translocase subunit YajC